MKNNKPKLKQFSMCASSFFIIFLPIISLAYFLWMRFGVPLIFFTSDYRKISHIGALVLFLSHVLAIFAIIFLFSYKYAKLKTLVLGLISFSLAIPTCCLSYIMLLYIPIILDTAVVNNETYYINW